MTQLAAETDVENDCEIFNIIHFSDVYDICGDNNSGASRFLSVLEMFKKQSINPLIFFSGNFISQSHISYITKGEHMIEIMNKFGIHAGILGNHDFDFGEDNTYNIIQKLNFPIIHTNILFKSLPKKNNTNNPLINKYFIINYNKNESIQIINNIENKKDEKSEETQLEQEEKVDKNTLKIGVIGICENWLNLICNRLDNDSNIIYMDMIEETEKYINKLRIEHNIDMIIGLTHSKLLNDNVLADKINGIDIILSKSDNTNQCLMTQHSRTLIVKSGYNFNFSWIKFIKPIQYDNNVFVETEKYNNINNGLKECLKKSYEIFKARNYWYNIQYFELNENIFENVEMKEYINNIMSEYNNKLNNKLGEIECNFDC
eukprot:158597_1